MNAEQFLIRQGWRKGEGLRPGAIKRALLVAHKRDNKGLGFNPQASEGWWERMFDGHLKSLDVGGGSKIEFKFDEEKRRRETSPLYASFLSGGFLNDIVPDSVQNLDGAAQESSAGAGKHTETKTKSPKSKKSSSRVSKDRKEKRKHKEKDGKSSKSKKRKHS